MADTQALDVRIKNSTGEPITNVYFYHQYSDKCSDVGSIMDSPLSAGEEKQIGQATFMTGFGSLGRDTWWIQFEQNGQKFASETDFQCTVMEDDAKTRRPVVLDVRHDGLKVMLPHTGDNSCSAEIAAKPMAAGMAGAHGSAGGMAGDHGSANSMAGNSMAGAHDSTAGMSGAHDPALGMAGAHNTTAGMPGTRGTHGM